MKVTGPGSTSSTSSTRRSDKAEKRSGEFARHLQAAQGVEESHVVEGAAPLTSVEALLAVQSMPDATDAESRRRAIRRGEDILERLEEIRRGLLLGTIPKDRLVQLASMVRSRRETVADPGLAAVLDEIELRAEVELAKLSRRP